MFMQSFENSNKQQQRRQKRQLALQRMEEAANVLAASEEVAGGEEGGPKASSKDYEKVDSISNSDTTDAKAASTDKRSNTLTSALNFLRESQQDTYSFEPATTTAAKQFLWDDQSACSNGSIRFPKGNSYDDVKSKKKPWNTIDRGGGGLWSALPVWGGGQQVDAANNLSGGSKYRDVEGERLLTLANERVKIDNISAIDSELGQRVVEGEDEDYDLQLRRRVFLDKNGTLSYDKSGPAETSHRMRMIYTSTMKRPAVLIFAVGIVIAIVSGSMFHKFTTKNSGDSNYKIGLLSGDINFIEIEVDGVKIDVEKERFDHIRSVILDSKVSTPAAFHDTKSAQFAALLWLVREDPRRMEPDSGYLLQRYGLAVLWFCTNKNKYYNVSEEFESDENGNTRRLGGQDMDKWFRHDDWLSEIGVCGWSGIKCYPHDNGLDHDGNNDGDVMEIALRRNNLRGAFPSEVFRALPFLQSLDLSDNALSGIISDDIGKMSDLQYFNLTINNIAGSIPNEIGDVTSLKEFHMSSNKLDSTIPSSVYKLEKLRALDLSQNSLSATIPHSIGALQELISLNLSFNSLNGPLPHELSNMKSLIDLDVSHNSLQGSLPNEIGFVTYLKYLDLSHNHFEGAVPTVIGQLEHLDTLYLNDNEFKGNIPTELSQLAELDVLNLANNHFTGMYPIWLTFLYELQELDISNNAVKGEIPRSIAEMKNLRILNLAGNDLKGLIPTELGSLFKLEQISLDTNELVGGIPDQLGELTSLRKLELHNNFLTGHVSDLLCKLSHDMFLTQFSVDCAGETAVILCECCQCHLHENIIRLNDEN